jgi:putative PIN family toxin of toxin-antitoxin system
VIVAVLDTNVLASGFVGLNKPESATGELLRRWRREEFALVVSDHILAELSRVVSYPYFAQRLSHAEIEAAFLGLRTEALSQSITVQVSGVASHAADDAVIATALSARAAYLVTGDKQLLERRSYWGTHFLTPRQFLEVLKGQITG